MVKKRGRLPSVLRVPAPMRGSRALAWRVLRVRSAPNAVQYAWRTGLMERETLEHLLGRMWTDERLSQLDAVEPAEDGFDVNLIRFGWDALERERALAQLRSRAGRSDDLL